MKGQLAVEWIVLAAVAVLVLVFVAGSWMQSQQSAVTQSQTSIVQAQLDTVTQTAKTVFRQGPGATQTLSVDLPEQLDVNRSGIAGYTTFLQLGSDTIRSVSSAPLQGNFPSKGGRYNIQITSRADYVWVGPLLATLSHYRLAFDLAPSSSTTKTIRITNPSEETITVNVVLPQNESFLTANSDSATFTLGAGESEEVSLSYTASALAFDHFDTNVLFNVSDGLVTEPLLVPVSIQFVGENSGGQLRFVPSFWSTLANVSETDTTTVRLCNDSSNSMSGLSIEPSTIYSVALPKLSGTVWSLALYGDQILAGTQNGDVYAFLSDFTYLRQVNVSSSPIRALSVQSNRAYASSTDGNVYAISLTDFNILFSMQQGGSPVKAVAADEGFVYAGSDDGIVNVFSATNGSWVTRVQNSTESVNAVLLDDTYLYFGSKDGSVYVYQKAGLTFERSISLGSSVQSLSKTSNGFLAGTQSGNIFSYRKSDWSIVHQTSIVGEVRSISAPLDESFVVVSAGEQGVYFLNGSYTPVLHTSIGTTMQSVIAKEDGDVFVGSIDLGAYAIRYAGFEQLVAGSWITMNDFTNQTIDAHTCKSISFSLTVPPDAISQVFAGTLSAQNVDNATKLYVQVRVQ